MAATGPRQDFPPFDLADHCYKARRYAKLSQKELAERSGISERTISRVESGATKNPTRAVLRQWALACGVPYEGLRPKRTTSRYARRAADRRQRVAA